MYFLDFFLKLIQISLSPIDNKMALALWIWLDAHSQNDITWSDYD